MSKKPSRATQHARAQVQAHLAATDTALRHAHAHMVASVQPALEVLLRDLQARRDAGEEVTLAWLYEGHRLAHFKQQVEQSVNHFSVSAQVIIGHAQRRAQAMGAASARAHIEEGRKK